MELNFPLRAAPQIHPQTKAQGILKEEENQSKEI